MKRIAILLALVVPLMSSCSSLRSAEHSQSLATSAEIKVGMTADEVIREKGRHFRINNHKRAGSVHIVYDDITVSVRDWAWGRPGRVVDVSLTTDRMRQLMKPMPYEDKK